VKTLVPIILLIPACLRAGDAAPAEPPLTPVARQEIVVTASASPELVSETPASVTVLGAEEIERSAARDLGTLLRLVPGLSVARSGSPGKVASLFTRGGSSKHTLVLVDGVPVNNPFFSGYDFGHLSTAGVERVEVVRGPFSALYGSEAVSGVINVLTARDSGFTSAELQAGERGLLDGRAGGAGGGEAWWASGSLETRRDEGFAANDDLAETSVLAEVRSIGASGFSGGVRARWTEYETGIPRVVDASGAHFVPSLERRESADTLELSLPLQISQGRSSWDVLIARSDRDEAFEDPLDPFARFWAQTNVETGRAAVTSRFAFDDHTIVAGGSWESATVADASSYGTNLASRRRSSRGVFVEDRASIAFGRGGVELSAGARYDRFDTFGGHLSPRAAAAYVAGTQKIRAAWGEAFRAPAIGELYFPFFGNEELEPERSSSVEIGWDGEFAAGRVSVTLFETDFDELIVYDNLANRFENVGSGWARGVEIGASRRAGPLHIAGSWTFLRTREDATGLPSLRRPEQSGSLSARWSAGAWALAAAAVHAGERADLTDLFPYGRVTAEPYTTLDLVIEKRIGEVTPYLGVENAADAAYEEIYGYPSPGRRAVAGVRMMLGP
jgi:vitamin B12 transporter